MCWAGRPMSRCASAARRQPAHRPQAGEDREGGVASPGYLARHGTPQVPDDLLDLNCLSFNFRRAEPGWPFREDGCDRALAVTGSIEANNGESLAQLARAGVGIARVGRFAVEGDLASGVLVPLLEAFNPQDGEPLHALFVNGSTTPARVRVFVDFLVERLAARVD